MKKIAFYRESILPISETFIYDQIISLKSWDPILIGNSIVKNGLKVEGVRKLIFRGYKNKFISSFARFFWLPDFHLMKILRNEKIDLVHIHFGTDAVNVGPSVMRLGLPMVVTLHGYDINTYKWWWEQGKGGFLGRLYPSRLLKIADYKKIKFIAVSTAIKEKAIKYGIPESKITVSHIGINLNKFNFIDDSFYFRNKKILFVGRMVEKKSPLLLIRAFASVKKDILDTELVMIGDGPLLEEAKRLCKDLELKVEFLGACSSLEVARQMSQARVFCLPSITAKNGDAEGLPIVVHEAQSSGVPVVTSADGAVSDAISDGAGISFKEGDLTELIEKLKEILTSEELQKKIRSIARDKVINYFEIEKNTEKLESIYNEMI